MKTPKQRFLDGPHAKEFFDLSTSPVLISALEYALMELVDGETIGGDERAAMRAGFRIEGARTFIKILTELPVKPEAPKAPWMPDNLET